MPKHFGGGEKHLLAVAVAMAKAHTVSIAIAGFRSEEQLAQIRSEYESFFNYSLKNITFINCPIPDGSFIAKLAWTRQFDYLYYVTDGSLFFSLAKKNNLHIQIPFTNKPVSIIERLKLRNWQIKNTNSHFTKRHIEKNWQTPISLVLEPCVEAVIGCDWSKKQKIILNVGRFFRQLHSKRQDVLVAVFKKLLEVYPAESKGWKLVLIGTAEDAEYVAQVRLAAQGLPIEIHTAVSRTELLKYYQQASLYWHATGYGVDQELEPEKLEHFGITTLEAMAAGAAPVVFNAGGQPEVLGEKLTSLLWNSDEECISITAELLQDAELLRARQETSIARAIEFDQGHFEQKVAQMLGL